MFEIDTYNNYSLTMIVLIAIFSLILFILFWKKLEHDTWLNIFFIGSLSLIILSAFPVSQNILRPEIENKIIDNFSIKSCDNSDIVNCTIIVNNKEYNINKIGISENNKSSVHYIKYKKNFFSNSINEKYSFLELNINDFVKYIKKEV